MTHEQIANAINALDLKQLSKIVFKSRRGFSKEDAITDLIAGRMVAAYPKMKLILRKGTKTSNLRPDLIHVDANGIESALEAKHYSSGQDGQFYKHVEGPIKDSLKLKGLGFDSHFILQYTSELVEISGSLVNLPKASLPDEIGFLRYYFNNKGFIANKIPAKPAGQYLQVLTNVFSNVFGQEVKPITLKVSKEITGGSYVAFNIHFFLMEVKWSAELEKRYERVLATRNVKTFMHQA